MPSRFITNFLLCFGLTLAGLFAFNYVLDPYDVNGRFQGPFNSAKEGVYKRLRLGTLSKMNRYQPSIVAVGNSSVQFLDLQHVHRHTAGRLYNLGLWGADADEVIDFALYALEKHQPVELLVGLSFTQFGGTPPFVERRPPPDQRPDIKGERYRWSLEFWRQYYLSAEATMHSIKGLLAWGKGPGYASDGSQTPEGLDYYLSPLGANPHRFTLHTHATRVLHGPFRWKDGRHEMRPQPESRWQLDPAKVERLRELTAACARIGTRCRFFVPPLARTHYEMFYDLGFNAELERWRKQLADITPYWDFATVNTVTRDQRYFFDTIHLTREGSSLLVERLYKGQRARVPADFGVFVTTDNVAAHNLASRPRRSNPIATYFPSYLLPNYLSRRPPAGTVGAHAASLDSSLERR